MARAGRAASRVLDDARHLKTHVESSANVRPAFGPNYPCSSPNTCPLVVPNEPGGFANKPSGFGTNEQGGFGNKQGGFATNPLVLVQTNRGVLETHTLILVQINPVPLSQKRRRVCIGDSSVWKLFARRAWQGQRLSPTLTPHSALARGSHDSHLSALERGGCSGDLGSSATT